MHLLIGVASIAVAWTGLRLSVGLRRLSCAVTSLAVFLDWLPPGIGFLLLLTGTGRPVLSALPILAAIAGLALTDRVKRDILREPVVFADRAELIEVLRHPRLYLPFAGTGLVVGGALAAIAGIAGLAWAERPLFPARPLLWPALGAFGVLCFWLPARRPILTRIARVYAALPVTRDPAEDMARFGMLATFILHATLARAERPARQQQARPAVLRGVPPDAGPIVLVQSESWFDVSRLHPSLRDWLPTVRELQAEAALHGRLTVPAWGANTVRSEFAVLTGLDEAQAGLDRFNPYAAFARVRLPSLAWHARAAGYRTVCVHPFDLSFYGRNHVLPKLGFDAIVGPEAFRDAARGGEWVCDRALGETVAQMLDDTPGRVLVFAISMECHGPYDDTGPGASLPPALACIPGAAELGRYLHRLRGAEAVLPVLRAALERRGDAGWLAFYGDHQPGLPRAFDALGLRDPRSDYLIWGTHARQRATADLAAHALGAALFEQIGA